MGFADCRSFLTLGRDDSASAHSVFQGVEAAFERSRNLVFGHSHLNEGQAFFGKDFGR